ncbi:MAG: extracellular solute-binding protein [Treponema sp.]|nr:extracellular solute-binding protein [Treponema sp.]
MKRLRFSIIFLLLVLAAAMVFAGGSNQQTTAAGVSSSSAANVNPPGVFPICKTPITIKVGVPQNTNVENFDTNKLTLWYEEKGNFTLNFELYPSNGAEARQKVELIMASGGADLPEVLIGFGFTEDGMLKMGQDGFALNLTSYYKDWAYYIPMILPQLKNKDYMQWLTSADGNIYYVPKSNEAIGNLYQLRSLINKSWLDKLGLSIPTTTNEFRTVLNAFVNKDPNGNGKKDEIGFIGSNGWGAQAADWVMNAYIYDDSKNRYVVDDTGKVDVAFTKPEWQEGLRFLNGLVKDGLMLPQTFTMNDTQMRQLTEGGDVSQVGAFTHGMMAAVFGATNVRKLEYVPLPPLTGPKGNCTVAFFPDIPQKNFVITKNAKNPEAIFRWADLMCSEEGYMRTRWGEPGVDWKVPGPNDHSLLESIGYGPKMVMILPWGSVNNAHWSFITAGIVPIGVSEGQVAPADDPLYTERWAMGSVPFYINKEPKNRVDIQKFTLQEAEEISDIRNSINSYVNESLALFSVGDKNIDRDWDAYLKELDAMGLKRYLELSQSGYDRAIGKK